MQVVGLEPKAGPEQREPVVSATEKVDVFCVVVSKDGKIVVGGAGMWDQPGEIGVWEFATRAPLQRFAEDLGVAGVALSPNGKLLASGSWTGHVRVYDWAVGKQLFDFPVEPNGTRVAFAPDGRLLATVTENKTAQLWDTTQGKLWADLEGDLFRFHCVTFSPDGKRVLAGGGDWKPGGIAQVTIWDAASKKQVGKLTGHQNTVLGICCSPDGKTIATASLDQTIRLWDAESCGCFKTLTGHTRWVEGVAFSADGKVLVSASLDGTVRFWDVATGMEKKRLTMPGPVRTVRFTPDGNLLAGGALKTLKVFAATTQQELGTLWNGAEPAAVAMERFPVAAVAAPTPVREKSWLAAAGLVALGLAFLVSLGFAAGLAVRRFRARRPPAATPEPLSFSCAECGAKLKAPAALAGHTGKKVKCPQCGKPTPIPESSAVQPSHAPARGLWAWRFVLAAFTTSGVFGALLVAGLWAARPSEEPYVSRLQIVANRVKAQQTDTIDARPYQGVTDRDLTVLDGLPHLKQLNLDHTETTDEGLKAVARATNLMSLSLTNTQVSDAGLAQLRTLTGLEDLRLDRLPITDAGLTHLSGFTRLRKLSLYKTGVTGSGLAVLQQLPSLERVSLDDTAVGDAGLRHLHACSNLKYLSVWRTRVTPAGLQELRDALPKLQVNR
jgi:DNA-directed RNA polymerase subunit RPC12/RpoP